jgi:chromosome segregation ATPase
MKKGNHQTLMTTAEKNSFESRIEELKTKVRSSQADIRTLKDKLTATEHSLSVETSKATTQAKKLEQQTTRLKDLDSRVIELQKDSLILESEKNQATEAATQLTTELFELQKAAKKLDDENERLRLRPSNKIYRTTRFGGNDALKDKIDFSKIELRKTSSKYLAGNKYLLQFE